MVERGRVARQRMALLAAIALLFVVLQPATAAPSVDPEALSRALQFRRTFGLSTDLARASVLELDEGADRKYSVALGPDEVAEMDRRMAIQEALLPLLRYGQRFPATFGGMYVDQAAGGIVHFTFTEDVDSHRAVLEGMAPSGAEIRVRVVSRTERELDALVEQTSRDLDFHASLGIRVHGVGAFVAENMVDMFVEPYSVEVAAAVRDRYGPGVRARPGTPAKLTACVNRDNCVGPPIMAGISNDWGCTVGFGVWMDGYRRFLTAGHCVQEVVDLYGWFGWEWFHYNVSLGLSTDEAWFDWSASDVGSMGNVSSSIHSNRVLYTTQPSWYGMYAAQYAGDDWVGQAICQSGQTTGFSCGTITNKNYTVTYYPSGIHMKWQRQANYFVQGGDSGGPVINSASRNLAVGMQSGMDAPYVAYYSHIWYCLMPNQANGGIGATLRTTDY